MANSTTQYLHVWLDEGRIKIQINGFHAVTGRVAVNDGHFQLVTVKLDATEVSLLYSTQSQGSARIAPIQANPGDLVFVGGLPDPNASSYFGGHFKGCIQDLRLNSRRLQFYPIATPVESYMLERLVNVTQGCSSDNACAVSLCGLKVKNFLDIGEQGFTSVLLSLSVYRSTPASTAACVSPCGTISSATAHPAQQGGAVRR